MLLSLIATPLFSGVCDISLLSMQLDQDFQLGISMKNVIQHMYRTYTVELISFFFLFFVIASWPFITAMIVDVCISKWHHCVVTLSVSCNDYFIENQTTYVETPIKMLSHQYGGNWLAEKSYRKDIQQKRNFYMQII